MKLETLKHTWPVWMWTISRMLKRDKLVMNKHEIG